MNIEFLHGRADFRRWQARLAEVLGSRPGLALRFTPVDGVPPLPIGVELLFALERIAFGHGAATAVDLVAAPAAPGFDGPADVVIDLSGAVPAAKGAVQVLCMGTSPLAGALAAVLADRVPVLEIVGADAAPRGRWAVAVEDPNTALRAVSQVLGRLAHMVIAFVDLLARPPAGRGPGAALDRLSLADPAGPLALAPFAAVELAGRTVASRIRRRLDRLVRTPPDWRVVWRRRDPATPPLAPHLDPTPFDLLPDDGRRFYADPFVATVDGRSWLFVEEFPYATGRGILSLAEIDADGQIATPRPFLEQDCHLSYPQVFEHAGVHWMVPETCERRSVELWRAERFPDRWVRHAVLIEGLDVADATLVERDGRWWMFASVREPWCSSWDALRLWHAPALEGPWTPFDEVPVTVDVTVARPAGRMIATAAGLLRPVQDSGCGYGCGLALMRVDRLDLEGFAETKLARFATPAPLSGLHTWNRAGEIEVMDVFAAADAFGPRRRLDLTPVSVPGADPNFTSES